MPNLDTVYRPGEVEARWSRVWLDRGLFRADAHSRAFGSYCIVIPPPNITGSLHVGHALNNTLQDILIRWHRMRGDATLWQPGTDHAGIATQNVVERQLLAEGTSRARLGRKAFVERVWAWRKESGGRIIEQLKRLGASCDWTRERFTLDEGLSAAVREVFVRLHHEGLIYRAERLINWCWRCGTALSDIEVEHEETAGAMYHIRYPLADDPARSLTVATTRPETMLGDTAVAVHPDDPRFNRLIGKRVSLPLTTRTIPIVGDAILVDREFGTGAVKITPGHDFNDEKAGHRHGLDTISLFDERGRINPSAFIESQVVKDLENAIAHKSAKDTRALVVERLERDGYLLKTEDHRHAIGKCYRCRTIVEPFSSPQWFVKVNDPANSLAASAIDAVRKGDIRLIPEGWVNNYLGWMNNIQDWCVSRQIWWGHRIPVWYCTHSHCDPAVTKIQTAAQAIGEGAALPEPSETTYYIGTDAIPIKPSLDNPQEAPSVCPRCGQAELIQDPDVLDTWFSSALWPFSTLGWPRETPELKRFYPTSTLVTSFDILFFWVARMIMMGLHLTKQVPFKDVYIHALVRDAEGQKMSKSKGNVIDPLSIMDQYGTDALRFTLAAMASPGRDVKLSEQRIEGYRNFANKLWNASRFVLMNTEGHSIHDDPTKRSLADRWITIQLQDCVKDVRSALESYRFDDAANRLYQFIWHEYCDWYIEAVKPRLTADADPDLAAATRATMVQTLETTLRLLHPFMPFITEEIWQKLPHPAETIVLAEYPEGCSSDDPQLLDAVSTMMSMQTVIAVVTWIRTFRSELNISPAQQLKAGFKTRVSYEGSEDIKWLASLSEFQMGPTVSAPSNAVVEPLSEGEVFVVPEGVDLLRETARLEKELAAHQAEHDRIWTKLKNPNFVEKAPPDIVDEHQDRVREFNKKIDYKSKRLNQLRKMSGQGLG